MAVYFINDATDNSNSGIVTGTSNTSSDIKVAAGGGLAVDASGNVSLDKTFLANYLTVADIDPEPSASEELINILDGKNITT